MKNTLFNMIMKSSKKEKFKVMYMKMGVDTTLTVSLLGNEMTVTADGGTGTHGDLQNNYPDLYFGVPACRYSFLQTQPEEYPDVWEFATPLVLPGKNLKIDTIECLDSGRGEIKCYKDSSRYGTMSNHIFK